MHCEFAMQRRVMPVCSRNAARRPRVVRAESIMANTDPGQSQALKLTIAMAVGAALFGGALAYLHAPSAENERQALVTTPAAQSSTLR
jgi:hypothetical protein